MDEAEEYYCKLFVDTELDENQLLSTIDDVLHGKVFLSSIVTQITSAIVNKNEEFDTNLRKDFPDGFLYFKYYIDVWAASEDLKEAHLTKVSAILEHLWSLGYPAVAASDYEDDLPHKGGYKSTEVPWVKTEAKLAM